MMGIILRMNGIAQGVGSYPVSIIVDFEMSIQGEKWDE